DKLVTGVQTCALPISGEEGVQAAAPRRGPQPLRQAPVRQPIAQVAGAATQVLVIGQHEDAAAGERLQRPRFWGYLRKTARPDWRSEERRVGKEGRTWR